MARGLVLKILVPLFFIPAQAHETNDDVKILTVKSTYVLFQPISSQNRLEVNSGPGLILNTSFCAGINPYSFDCRDAVGQAFGLPLLNQLNEVQVSYQRGQAYGRNGGSVYEVTGLIKAAAYDSPSFQGVGLHAHNVGYWEALHNKQWGFLVGANDAGGGFLSKGEMEKTKAEVTLKSGEKAYTFRFVLAHVNLLIGSSKPFFMGMTVRPNALYRDDDRDYVRWDNVQNDYYLSQGFDRSEELLGR